MITYCRGDHCHALKWMKLGLLAAGICHLLAGAWILARELPFFHWIGWTPPDHALTHLGPGLLSIAVGISLLVASHSPIRSWPLVLFAFLKINLFALAFLFLAPKVAHADRLFIFLLADDLIWWLPLATTLWASAKSHLGSPFIRVEPLSLDEASAAYRLSSGETLKQAASQQVLAMVFLRHFGCTFTRKILSELEQLKSLAEKEGARLVLVHLLDEGRELQYVGKSTHVARIADPMCELYQAFGLGKGGFIEIFGPKVWWRWVIFMVKGCGVGHFIGDGLQMPGAFLFHDGRILAAQRASSQSDLPNLPGLFERLPVQASSETVPA